MFPDWVTFRGAYKNQFTKVGYIFNKKNKKKDSLAHPVFDTGVEFRV